MDHATRQRAEPAVTAPPLIPTVVDVVVLHRTTARGRARADAGGGHRWQALLLQRGTQTRCPGSWEVVHGRIERGERAEDAAVREVVEETGLTVERLYAITANAFYLAGRDLQVAVVFAAVVGEGDAPPSPTLGTEHVAARWQALAPAARSVTWPREREALAHIAHLLRTGDAGVAEDVLRVR
jgi:8-oxo-dGTP pyrophosphatase MutT (NUDIX family)